MKCDKLKSFIVLYNGKFERVYADNKVNAAIEELKQFAENSCLERDDNQTAIDELNAENRKLKRALWLARAERASDKARIFYFAMTERFNLNIDGFSIKEKGRKRMRSARWWELTWMKVERKCRDKAEEYK